MIFLLCSQRWKSLKSNEMSVRHYWPHCITYRSVLCCSSRNATQRKSFNVLLRDLSSCGRLATPRAADESTEVIHLQRSVFGSAAHGRRPVGLSAADAVSRPYHLPPPTAPRYPPHQPQHQSLCVYLVMQTIRHMAREPPLLPPLPSSPQRDARRSAAFYTHRTMNAALIDMWSCHRHWMQYRTMTYWLLGRLLFSMCTSDKPSLRVYSS